MAVWQNLIHFLAYSDWYSPALKEQEMAAAVRGARSPPKARPPPCDRLYTTPPRGVVESWRYFWALSMMPLGTTMPALRAARSAWSWVMVTEPSSELWPSAADV